MDVARLLSSYTKMKSPILDPTYKGLIDWLFLQQGKQKSVGTTLELLDVCDWPNVA